MKFFYNFFLPQTFKHQQYEAVLKQNDHFQTHKNLELSFFSHEIALVMQFSGKRKITLQYAMFINIKDSCQCLQINTLMSDFGSVYCSILSKMVCTFLDDFL